jgi:8-oxo-dGTP pyrophosphatase MutT (NUDIX family)
MKKYVLGYVFYQDAANAPRVFLIRKNRPAWMVGRWNGLGGKIEEGETPPQAMRREFREEGGVDVEQWTPLVHIQTADSSIHVFSAAVTIAAAGRVHSATDEMVLPFYLDAIPENVLPNVRWMVHMAALHYTNPDYVVLGYPTLRTGKHEVAKAA